MNLSTMNQLSGSTNALWIHWWSHEWQVIPNPTTTELTMQPWVSFGLRTDIWGGVTSHHTLEKWWEASDQPNSFPHTSTCPPLPTPPTRREPKTSEGKGEKERYTHLNAEFQRIARRDKKAFLSEQGKPIQENKRMGKTRDLFKKIRDTKGTFRAKVGIIKDSMDLIDTEDIKKRWPEYTEGNGTPLQYSCLENPMNAGA